MRILSLFLLTTMAGFGAFRAAVVKVDITPTTSKWLMGYAARQSTGVLDPIAHRIVALDDGRTLVLIVSTDVCVFSPAIYDEMATRIEKETGIGRARFWWTVTHTHSAPEIGPPGLYDVLLKGRSNHAPDMEYTHEVMDKLLVGAKAALAKLEPARLAAGTGMALANINRRARDVDGKISLGLNPDGPVDRQIGLIRIDRMDGTPLVLLANYAMHGTVLGGQFLKISGDAQGTVANFIEKKLGAPMLYLNGAAGNIAPIYSVYADNRSGHLTQFNVLLGERILAANQNLGASTGEVSIWAAEDWLETPRKPGLAWSSELNAYNKQTPSGAAMVRLPLRFLKINDTAIWGGPVEMFCEIAMTVRNHSPFARTFFFGYTNGWLGYLPTKTAFAEGGYEPDTSPFSDAVEQNITEEAIRFLQSIPR